MQIRRQLRARRLAEKQAQMRAALAEKVARDVQESAENERKVELREEYKQRMAAWRQVGPLSSFTHLPAHLSGKQDAPERRRRDGAVDPMAWRKSGNSVEHHKVCIPVSKCPVG